MTPSCCFFFYPPFLEKPILESPSLPGGTTVLAGAQITLVRGAVAEYNQPDEYSSPYPGAGDAASHDIKYSVRSAQSPYPHRNLLYRNVSTKDITFITANSPTPVVNVPYVQPGFYEVSFDGSVQFPAFANASSATSDTVTCYITVSGIRQSAGETTVRENTGAENGFNEVIPFAVTDVVYVPLGGTVEGTCQDTNPHPNGSVPSTTTTVLARAQITLVQGKHNPYTPGYYAKNIKHIIKP